MQKALLMLLPRLHVSHSSFKASNENPYCFYAYLMILMEQALRLSECHESQIPKYFQMDVWCNSQMKMKIITCLFVVMWAVGAMQDHPYRCQNDKIETQ